MRIVLHIWRQRNANDKGRMVRYEAPNVNAHMSFLEMLDVLNEDLVAKGEEPVAFDHDCREGICGSCGSMVNGRAHGPEAGTTLCQLHMRKFQDRGERSLETLGAPAARGPMVSGRAHGPEPGTTLCQLHMRKYKDGDEISLEPWRARAPRLQVDLVAV